MTTPPNAPAEVQTTTPGGADVDPLAVIDRLIGNTRTMADMTGDPRIREHLREGEQARRAVAALLAERGELWGEVLMVMEFAAADLAIAQEAFNRGDKMDGLGVSSRMLEQARANIIKATGFKP